jgi:hypothetical protein
MSMISSIGMFLVAIIIASLEVPALLKQKLKKDLILFLFLLFSATNLTIFRILDLPLLNPTDGLMAIFAPMSHWLEQLLK